MNWKGFAVRSAKSQSGNLTGLGSGLVAQVVWGYSGADKAVAQQAERALR